MVLWHDSKSVTVFSRFLKFDTWSKIRKQNPLTKVFRRANPHWILKQNKVLKKKNQHVFWQERRGDGGVPASGYEFWEGTERDSGGDPQDEDGHQGSGGQSSYWETGEEPITSHQETEVTCFVSLPAKVASRTNYRSQCFTFVQPPSWARMSMTFGCTFDLVWHQEIRQKPK